MKLIEVLLKIGLRFVENYDCGRFLLGNIKITQFKKKILFSRAFEITTPAILEKFAPPPPHPHQLSTFFA